MAMLLENMQVFARVVELGSLSAAGRHLRLSPAVVSHRLQQLYESRLSAKCRLGGLPLRNIAPRPHDLKGIAILVADQT